jgi:hypothetical protein
MISEHSGIWISKYHHLTDRHTDKGVWELFLVKPVHIDGAAHMALIIGKQIIHDGSRQTEAVIRIHPIILNDLRIPRVRRSKRRRRRTRN